MQEPTNLDEALKILRENIHLNGAPANFPDLAKYLGHSGDERVFEPLLEGLKFGGEYIRAMSALGLGYLGNKEAVPYLIDAFLNDKGLYVRCDAALALGILKSEAALTVLVNVFPLENFEVQKRIIRAVETIDTDKALKALFDLEKNLEKLSDPKREFLQFLIKEGLYNRGLLPVEPKLE